MKKNSKTYCSKKCSSNHFCENDLAKKVVVTGGAGFIGSNLTHTLVDMGFDVYVIDDLSSGKEEKVNKGAKFFKEDIRNIDAVKKIIDGAEYVFHLAARPRVQSSIEDPIGSNDVNVNGTLNVLVAAKDTGAKKFIYSASSSAYGNQENMPLREDMHVDPLSPYGFQKYAGELYSKIFSEVYSLPTVSLRYFNVYGPGLDPEGDYALVIGRFFKQAKENKPLTIVPDGEQSRDFTHVRDVVRANILAMNSNKVGRGEVINIGAGKDYTVNQLAAMIGGETEFCEPRIEPKHTCADNKKAKELLGWEPQVSFEDGMGELKKIFLG